MRTLGVAALLSSIVAPAQPLAAPLAEDARGPAFTQYIKTVRLGESDWLGIRRARQPFARFGSFLRVACIVVAAAFSQWSLPAHAFSLRLPFGHQQLQLRVPDKARLAFRAAHKAAIAGDFRKAVEEYTRGIGELPPGNQYLALALTLRCINFHKLGELDNAAKDCKRATDLAPWFADAHSNLGGVDYDRDDFAAAEAEYSRYIKLQPKDLKAM